MEKKVLFIIPSLAGGGTEKVLIDILRNMDYSRYEVSLFLEFGEGVYINDIPKEVEVLSFYNRHAIWHDRWFRMLRMFHLYKCYHSSVYKFLIRRLLKGKRFDTIVSFMEGNALKFHSYVSDKADKNISWIHIDLKRKHWSLDFFRYCEDERDAYMRMDKIVCVSEDVRNAFLELYPALADKSMVIYNPIDRNRIITEADGKQIEKNGFTICMVGRLNKQKRYDRALAVAKKLHEEGCDFELWILGNGNLEAPLKQMTNNYGIEKHVRFLGFKKPSYGYMKTADIFLNTSEAEGYPLVICEALCLGLAIVATNISGNKEILADSEYGLLTDETEEAVYRGIKLVMEDEGLRESYRKKALGHSHKFDIGNTMSQIYQIL